MRSEYLEHCIVATWLRVRGIPFHHSPNETYTTSHAQKTMNKKKGVSPGFPDLMVFGKRLVFVELKREKGGRASPAQLEWQRLLRERGFVCEICEGAQAAISLLEQYV